MTLISDITMTTLLAHQRNGVVQRCAKAPAEMQNPGRAAELSAPITFPQFICARLKGKNIQENSIYDALLCHMPKCAKENTFLYYYMY